MGSTKDLSCHSSDPTEKSFGYGRFIFSDDFSVFDWGKMPDKIPGKGSALCLMSAYFFERAGELGINNHYRSVLDSNGRGVQLEGLDRPSKAMDLWRVRVVKPEFIDGEYDYSMFHGDLRNFLIPLEIIYRNSLPDGSGVFRRLERGEIQHSDLGLDHYPEPGEVLERPFFEVSTKLEQKDRYIRWSEAQEIAGLRDSEVKEIQNLLSGVNGLISNKVGELGLFNADGKIELAYGPGRELILVDVVGTLDECRFLYGGEAEERDGRRFLNGGIHVSKEVARQFYKKSQWANDLERAKREAKEKGIENWRDLVKSEPGKLDEQLRMIISFMYSAAANGITGRKFFDCPSLDAVVKDYEKWLERD